MENFTSYPPEIQEMILMKPGRAPPDGVKPNFENPDNSNNGAIALLAVCVSLAVIMGVIRLYSRLFVVKLFRFEDYLGMFAFVPFAGGIWVIVRYLQVGGVMVHQWDIHLKDVFELLKVLLVLRIVYCTQMICAKTAILLEWTRIFVPTGTRNTFFWLSVALIIFNILVYVSAIIASTLSCIPTNKIWQPWVSGRCYNRQAIDVTTAWTNLVVDLFILMLPQRIIWTLQMSSSRKIGVSIIFSIGLMVVASAIGRIHSNMTLDYDGDTTYDASINTLWGFAEMTGVLIVFCAPAAPKAFSGQGLFSGMVATLRSWTRISDPSAQQSNMKSGEESLSRGSAYPASSLKPSASKVNDTELGPDDEYAANNGIYRMTQMEHREESASRTSAEPIIDRQHPWMKRKA